jgi:hypothetical protein
MLARLVGVRTAEGQMRDGLAGHHSWLWDAQGCVSGFLGRVQAVGCAGRATSMNPMQFWLVQHQVTRQRSKATMRCANANFGSAFRKSEESKAENQDAELLAGSQSSRATECEYLSRGFLPRPSLSSFLARSRWSSASRLPLSLSELCLDDRLSGGIMLWPTHGLAPV